jgi:mannose/fructose/N-acetylgalactosamine-specific phosphotransferase system component IIC
MVALDSEALAILALVGGLVAIDGTSFGQFMISRPFVACILGGWVAGSPQQGAMIGLVLESFHLGVLPVGAAKYPESGPASVAAGALYATVAPTPSLLALTAFAALLLERLGGRTVHLMRLANVRLVAPGGVLPTAENLERRHLAAIALDFLRGAILVVGGTLALALIVPTLDRYWGLNELLTGWLLMIFVVAMLASALKMLGSKYWFAAVGAGIGLVGLYFGR